MGGGRETKLQELTAAARALQKVKHKRSTNMELQLIRSWRKEKSTHLRLWWQKQTLPPDC